MIWGARRPAYLVAASAVLPLAACGSAEIDSGKTETVIRDNLAGPPASAIECPGGVEAKKDETFVCSVFYENGQVARVTVHIESDDGRIRVGPDDFERPR